MVGDYFRCSCYARQLSIVVGCDFVLIAECKGISKAGISYKRSVKLSLTSPFLFVPARYDDEGVVDPVSFFFSMQLIVHLCSAEMAVAGRCFQDVRAHVPAAVVLARL